MIARLRLLGVRSVRRRAGVAVLAVLGGTLTTSQAVVLAAGADDVEDLRFVVIPILVVGTIVAVSRVLPRASVSLRHPHGTGRLTLEQGDLFDVVDSPIVITMNRNLDVARPWVPDESLIRQLVRSWFDGDDAPVRRAVGLAPEQPGLREAVDPGTVVELRSGERRALLLAVSNRNDETRSTVATGEIWDALQLLWMHCRREGYPRVSAPVIGAGFSESRIGQAPLLMLLITSFVASSLEGRTCELRVLLRGEPAERIHLQQLAIDYCRLLGLDTVT